MRSGEAATSAGDDRASHSHHPTWASGWGAYITLELAEHFVEFDDPVAQVLVPMDVNLAVGLGDERERAEASHEAAARLYDSIMRG